MKIYLLLAVIGIGLSCVTSCSNRSDEVYILSSPDGRLSLTIQKDSIGLWEYSFIGNGEELIKNSRLGYESVQDEMIPSGDWSVSVSERSHDGIWKPVWGKREQVKDLYNELTLSFVAPTDQQGLKAFEMVFRVYNDGVAFRYMVPDSEKKIVGLKSATKLFSVLLASKRPLITELADKLRLKYPLLPTISPCPTMRLEAIRSIIPISCRRYPKSV